MELYRKQFQTLGLRIAYYRKKAGWTQAEFADKVGCSPGYLSRVEANNGKQIAGISLSMLFRMAEVLDVPVTKFFED